MSRNIESFINTKFNQEQRIEFFNISPYQTIFYTSSIINSVTSLKYSYTGEFTGEESDVTDYILGTNNKSIITHRALTNIKTPKGLKLVYTGGLAIHGTRTDCIGTNLSGNPLAGNYIRNTNGAVGILTSVNAPNFTYEALQGVFEAGDVLTISLTENGSAIPATTASILSITNKSLVEQYPEIGMACDMQIRYMFKHKDNFEDTNVNRDSSTFGNTQYVKAENNIYELRPEVRSMLLPLRRFHV